MIKVCETCGFSFNAKRSRYRFCGSSCAGRASSSLVSVTTFRKGLAPHNEAPTGAVVIRLDHGTYRAWIKSDAGWRGRARVTWEASNGPIPRGRIIHHTNEDTLDDRIENLECLTRAEHLRRHQTLRAAA